MSISVRDKIAREGEDVLISGTQALARLPLIQRQLDTRSGLNTGGYICGYRGSPLGNLDMTLLKMQETLDAAGVIFQPGLNEELALTAVAGTQQLHSLPSPTVDGVYAFWYGKGPGVDRAMDAIKHANFAGAHAKGGVLLVYGDDHPGKSSTVAHQSEQALAAQLVPSLYPATVQEIMDFGILGWALSRYSGAWVGLKGTNETLEQTASCIVAPEDYEISLPPSPGHANEDVSYRAAISDRVLTETIAHDLRLFRVKQFVHANHIDHVSLQGGNGGLGIVTAGKSWRDVHEALNLLGITAENATAASISVFKVGCIWPLEPQRITQFAANRQELFVIEEKKAFLEAQVASLLYNQPDRPTLTGKKDPEGNPLLSSTGQLTPFDIASAILARLRALGRNVDGLEKRLNASQPPALPATPLKSARIPFFCSGCPHNRSTKIPDGSHAMVGTGCATMEVFFRPDRLVPAQMGGEGANWIGLAPFSSTRHIFQNMGDGTYFHSGILSIRAAVAAKVNMTFKMLYNDAVAMTGGQAVDGNLPVRSMIDQILAEGVARCVLVCESPSLYDSASLPAGVDIFPRQQLDTVQKRLRETPGCTVLVYEQTCAAEKRRRRKKGTFPDPAKRVHINEAVCEGCGDCSTQSSCISVQPLQTEFGEKRQIDQSSCNKDFSCVEGFCPAFVTVKGGTLRKPTPPAAVTSVHNTPPSPRVAGGTQAPYNIMLAGVGGSGVITVGSVLIAAAHIEGKAVSSYDMTGLAQKNGAVYTHVRIAQDKNQMATSAIPAGTTDLVLGFDLIATVSGDSLPTLSRRRTACVGNSDITPTAKFPLACDSSTDDAAIQDMLKHLSKPEECHLVDATGIALALCGDKIAANFFLVGVASQLGLLPVAEASIREALRQAKVAVDFNIRAFELGRAYGHAPETVKLPESKITAESKITPPQNLDNILQSRHSLLQRYQNTAYADAYRETVQWIREVEEERAPGAEGLAGAVAHNYAKLLAYKDEYEVARLFTTPEFRKAIEDRFSGDFSLHLNLAPPGITNMDTPEFRNGKREYGPWTFRLFALMKHFKFLRGTLFDPFGLAADRRVERQLIKQYEGWMDEVAQNLTTANHADALELLSLPDTIRGFGPVKNASIEKAKSKATTLLKRLKGTQ